MTEKEITDIPEETDDGAVLRRISELLRADIMRYSRKLDAEEEIYEN